VNTDELLAEIGKTRGFPCMIIVAPCSEKHWVAIVRDGRGEEISRSWNFHPTANAALAEVLSQLKGKE
jgi:hypothetical protein